MTEPHRIEVYGEMIQHKKGCRCVVCSMEVRVHRASEREPTELEQLIERALNRLSQKEKA